MIKREIALQIQLVKNQLTLAQLEKTEFIEKLGGLREYEGFINERFRVCSYEFYK